MSILNKKITALILGIALILFSVMGCSKKTANSSTGGPVATWEMTFALSNNKTPTDFGAQGYLTIDKKWLQDDFWPKWKEDLWSTGITKWNGKFQCNAFAFSFVTKLTELYFIESWYSSDVTESLAAGIIWYKRDVDPIGSGHAVVAFFDENKELWGIEIQNGKVFKFTETEIQSMILELFP